MNFIINHHIMVGILKYFSDVFMNGYFEFQVWY